MLDPFSSSVPDPVHRFRRFRPDTLDTVEWRPVVRANSIPLAAAVGARVRALREAHQLRQEDVAQAARSLGFRWTRTAVANLEAGHRRLSAAELLVLPDMLNFARLDRVRERSRPVVELADLIPEDEWIALTNESRILGRALRMVVRGELSRVRTTDLDIPALREMRAGTAEALAGLHRVLGQREAIWQAVWPEAGDPEMLEAAREAAGESEQKAARRLGVPAFAVALEARRRWHRSLSAERDRRVTAQGRNMTERRTLQALRGHISRSLLSELQDLRSKLAEAGLEELRHPGARRTRAARGSSKTGLPRRRSREQRALNSLSERQNGDV